MQDSSFSQPVVRPGVHQPSRARACAGNALLRTVLFGAAEREHVGD